jgi:Tfp pilus assembly protein PilF
LYLLLADALVSDQQIDPALQAVRKSIEIKPDQFVAQSQIPWVLYRGKRYDDAKRQYLAFLDKFDSRFDNDQIRRICRQARFILSTLALREGDFPSAERWLEEVLDEFPEDIGAFNDLGYLWADQNKHLARSLVMVKRAVAAEPNNAAYRDSLGWVYYRLGQFQQAVVELEKAVAQTADGVILDHLGDAYLKLEHPAKAQATWERALAVFKAENNLQQIESVQKKLRQFRTTDT